MQDAASSRLIVALDLPSVDDARAMVGRIGAAVSFYKIGLELAVTDGGLDLARRLVGDGKQVFLDLKLHDIPNTVTRATARVATMGVRFLTVHAYPQTMKAALDGLEGSALQILGVTVLTSASDDDLHEAGYAETAAKLVLRRARQARDIGLPGLVMSPLELAMARDVVGPSMVIVTPGVRPAGDAVGDQKRVMSPGAAIRAGADHLVVGRPITEAPDPRAAAEAILQSIETAA